MNNEEKILEMLEKQAKQLEKQDARFEKIETQLAEQGKQLAELHEKVNSIDKQLCIVATRQEHTVIPRLNTLDERQRLMQERLAGKEDLETLRDEMAEWEVANKAVYSELWKRVAKLERKAE